MYVDKNEQAAQLVEAELRSDESLLWAGQPDPLRLARQSLPQAGFGVIWLAMVLFMMNFAGGMRGGFGGFGSFNSIFSLVLTVFFFVGVGLVLSPLWGAYKATRTAYAVTDRRLVIVTQIFGSSVKSYGPQDIESVERRGGGDGSGDVIFAREQRTSRSRSSSGFSRTRYYTVPVGFFGIPNAREVEQLILDTFRQGEGYGEKPKRDW